jgi:flagellin-like protein
MNYNKIIRKFKKNSKGLSPVVASIILIAVTVAVSVVVAAWMGGMTIGLMGNAEQVSVTNIQFKPGTDPADDQIVALVQNSGSSPVTIANAFVNGASPETMTTTYPDPTPTPVPATNQILKSSSAYVTLNVPFGTISPGSSYTIKLVTEKGTQISQTAIYTP